MAVLHRVHMSLTACQILCGCYGTACMYGGRHFWIASKNSISQHTHTHTQDLTCSQWHVLLVTIKGLDPVFRRVQKFQICSTVVK